MVASYAPVLNRAVALRARTPDSLPDATRAAGEPTSALPFDHLVIVMMENHSFDNYLGMLPRRGQPAADGFDFDAAGNPVNSNPVKGGYITVKRAGSLPAGTHHPELALDAPRDERRAHGRLRQRQHRPDGLLGRGRPALLLLAGQDLLRRRPLVLLGAVPDLSQPAFSVGRHRVRPDLDRHFEGLP